MKLSLSTAASPDVAPGALDDACRGRGLDGIELVLDDGEHAEAQAARARASGARIVALRAERFDWREATALARASGQLGVPVSVPPDGVGAGSLATLARAFAAERARLLLGFRTVLDQVVAAVGALREAGCPPSLGLAWELRPSSDDLREHGAVLLAAREQLGLVRLHGGGPEQRDQDGRGVGALFVDLALSGYAGPIVLRPSSSDELPRWRDWLGSRKSAGCGSAHPSGELELDVRDVEPRDRLGTILGAYRALARGATLRITLDHDPSCMVYALEASEPPGSFGFRKVEDGPEVWGAEVTKGYADPMGPLSRYLCDEHERIEADLRAAIADPAAFEAAPYERARLTLLRHIAIEEKVLLPFARERRGGEPMPIAARLRKEHGALASLLVPTPDHALVEELLGLLASHNRHEEGPGALYEEIEQLAGAGVDALLESARAQPLPPAAKHFDGKGTHRTAAAALRAHGL